MRKERCARSCKRKHLKTMYNGSGMAVPGRPDRIIMNRVVVCRHGLERRSMRIGQRATGSAKDVANLQVVELPSRHD